MTNDTGVSPSAELKAAKVSPTIKTATPTSSPDDHDIDHLRQQSSQKLKLAWESIYRKFENAHLQAQDEIYLGRPTVKGDSMRVIRDRGHLRSLSTTPLGFGCFHIDEAELIGCDAIKKEGHMEVGEVDCRSEAIVPRKERGQAWNEVQQRTVWSVDDPDLREFLRAEAERREMRLDQDNGEDEEEEAVDVFGSSCIVDLSALGWVGQNREKRKKHDHSEKVTRPKEGSEVYSLALAAWDAEESRKEESTIQKADDESKLQITPIVVASLSLPDTLSRPSKSSQTPQGRRKPSNTPCFSGSPSIVRSMPCSKRKRSGALTPRWKPSTPSVQGPNGACQGEGKCTKSLCLMCGGI